MLLLHTFFSFFAILCFLNPISSSNASDTTSKSKIQCIEYLKKDRSVYNLQMLPTHQRLIRSTSSIREILDVLIVNEVNPSLISAEYKLALWESVRNISENLLETAQALSRLCDSIRERLITNPPEYSFLTVNVSKFAGLYEQDNKNPVGFYHTDKSSTLEIVQKLDIDADALTATYTGILNNTTHVLPSLSKLQQWSRALSEIKETPSPSNPRDFSESEDEISLNINGIMEDLDILLDPNEGAILNFDTLTTLIKLVSDTVEVFDTEYLEVIYTNDTEALATIHYQYKFTRALEVVAHFIYNAHMQINTEPENQKLYKKVLSETLRPYLADHEKLLKISVYKLTTDFVNNLETRFKSEKLSLPSTKEFLSLIYYAASNDFSVHSAELMLYTKDTNHDVEGKTINSAISAFGKKERILYLHIVDTNPAEIPEYGLHLFDLSNDNVSFRVGDGILIGSARALILEIKQDVALNYPTVKVKLENGSSKILEAEELTRMHYSKEAKSWFRKISLN